MEKFIPESLYQMPNKAEIGSLGDREVERLRAGIDQDFIKSMQLLESPDIADKERKAFEGSLLIKNGLKLASTFRVPSSFSNDQFLRRWFSPEQRMSVLSGFAAERGFAQVAVDMGVKVYLSDAEDDVRYGVDSFCDVSEMGNERFAIEGTFDEENEDFQYNYLAVSIKSSVDIPLADNFSLVYPCRTMDELTAKLQEQEEAYFTYFTNFGESRRRVEQRWSTLTDKCRGAFESMYGFEKNGRRKAQPIQEIFTNVEPVLVLMPSINDTYARHYSDGLPTKALEQRLVESMME